MLKRESPPFGSSSLFWYNIKSSTSLPENLTILSLWPADGKAFAWSRRDHGPVWIREFLFSSFLQAQNLNEIPSSPSVCILNVIFSILSIAHASLYCRFYPNVVITDGHKLLNVRSGEGLTHWNTRNRVNCSCGKNKIKWRFLGCQFFENTRKALCQISSSSS